MGGPGKVVEIYESMFDSENTIEVIPVGRSTGLWRIEERHWKVFYGPSSKKEIAQPFSQ